MNPILLVGELNPYGVDPAMALYPLPRQASGNRLREILEVSDRYYLKHFDRVNLCTRVWSVPRARERAAELIAERRDRPGKQGFVLCGAQVAAAFGEPYNPGVVVYPASVPIALLILPHPSGRNRAWADREMYDRCRQGFRSLREHIGDLPLTA